MTQDTQLMTLLERIADSLSELVVWNRVTSYSEVKQILETALDTEHKRLVYHLTDGEHSVKAIQEEAGGNVRYISEWWREWDKIGIVEQNRHQKIKGRRQKLFDLASFGISVPDNSTD